MVACLVLQGHSNPTKALLNKRYVELNQATKAMNAHLFADWMNRYTTHDFFYRTSTGAVLTSDQTVETMRRQFAQTSAVKQSDFKMSNFGVHGDRLTCTITTHVAIVLKGGRRFSSTSTSVDTWAEKNGAWKLASVVTTSEVPK